MISPALIPVSLSRETVRLQIQHLRFQFESYLRQYKKETLTTVILTGGFCAVIVFSDPVVNFVPLVTTILLGTDYAVLDRLRLTSVRRRIEDTSTTFGQIQRNLNAKQLIEGPGYIEPEHQNKKNFRATVDGDYDIAAPLPFRLHVEEPNHNYKLRVGRCRLTKVREKSNGDLVLFFTLTKWNRSFTDDDEKDTAEAFREEVRTGSVDRTIYARPIATTELNELTLEEWRELHQRFDEVRRHLNQ
jgi:hypothetical protein